jgi:hypothetical protein
MTVVAAVFDDAHNIARDLDLIDAVASGFLPAEILLLRHLKDAADKL